MNFLIKYKKILLGLGFILTVAMIGYLLFILFFQTPEEITQTPVATTTTGQGILPTAQTGTGQIVDDSTTPEGGGDGLPDITQPDEIASGGVTKSTNLTEDKVVKPNLNSDGATINYLNQSDGKFYRINKDGDMVALSDKVFHSAESIVWSPIGDKAIIEYPDGANIVYNFETEKQVTLPAHWEEFDFAKNGSNIVAKSIGMEPGNRWLIVANEDGSRIQPIEPLGDKADSVYSTWSPNNQIVGMYTKGIDADSQEVFFMGLNEENFKSMVIPGRGFQHKWSPKGDNLLYSVYNTESRLKPELWVSKASGDEIGENRHRLNVQTWAEKCTFVNNTDAYCAVPESLEYASGMIPELAKNVPDRVYKIDINTGLKKLVAIPDTSFNMENLTVSENGYYLYFTDKNDNQLHQIKLKQ